ncbi:hypothetical protein Bca4012_020051 [Brassica carinata]
MDLKLPLQNVIEDDAHPPNKNSSSSVSIHSKATPDPRWPSKCRWSMESPPPAKSPGSVLVEETLAGSELSSTLTAVSDGNKDMMHQIDFIDLEPNPKNSSEPQSGKKLGESNGSVEPELERRPEVMSPHL